MNYSIFRFTLNMHNHRSQASVAAFKGDTAVRLLINLTDGGNPYIIADGCTAVLSGTKADGSKLYNRCVILNNTTVQYDFTEQTTSWAGVVNCDLIIYGADGREITAPKFIIVIDEREIESFEIISEDERTAIGVIFDQENKREEAETARKEAELGRVQAEEARAEAESLRVEAENQRVNTEILRANAENLRVEAEKKREKTIENFIAEVREEVNSVEETLFEVNEGGIE